MNQTLFFIGLPGVLLAVVGHLMLLFHAFHNHRNSWVSGMFFLPLVDFLYIHDTWPKTRIPAALLIVGTLLQLPLWIASFLI